MQAPQSSRKKEGPVRGSGGHHEQDDASFFYDLVTPSVGCAVFRYIYAKRLM